MTTIIAEPEVEIETAAPPIVLRLEPVVRLSEDQFFEFCQINQDVRLERTSQREIIVMSPLGGMSGKREVKVMTQLENWSAKNGSGETFSCNTGFRLPNGAMRAPDASWVSIAGLLKK